MSEMVERVARAICLASGFDPDESWAEFDRSSAATVTMVGQYPGWEDDVFPEVVRWHQFLTKAKAAIAAMRKPSKRMLRAACKAMSPGRRPTQRRVGVMAKHGIRYRAMIEAALETPAPGDCASSAQPTDRTGPIPGGNIDPT